jgi:hypothetical protein
MTGDVEAHAVKVPNTTLFSDDGLDEIRQFIAKKQLTMTGDVEAHAVKV